MSGSIKDRAQTASVPGAWVEVSGPLDQPHQWVQTDAEGRFTVVALAGRLGVEVVAAPPPFLVPLPMPRVELVEVPDAIKGVRVARNRA